MAENKKYEFSTEVITLPSKGLGYAENHPLKGEIEIKYMIERRRNLSFSKPN